MLYKNIVSGQIIGRWTVIKRVENNPFGSKQYQCICTCGQIRIVRGSSLTNGNSTSCGCYIREVTANRSKTHRKTNTKEYHTWSGLLNRCRNPNNKDYKYYGGRGITVCERWLDFTNFYVDMGDAPTRDHTLDRIDNDKGYFPENCRWTTWDIQARNKDYISVYRMWDYVIIHCPMCNKKQRLDYSRGRKKENSYWIATRPYCCEVMEHRETEEWYKLIDERIVNVLAKRRIVSR